jgi:hypothetical protein
MAGIRGGIECALLAPRLAALADGAADADADDRAALGPHLQTCLRCRDALKQLRAAAPRRSSGARSRRRDDDWQRRPPGPGQAATGLTEGEGCREAGRHGRPTQT